MISTVKAYPDRKVKGNSHFRISKTDKDLFDMIREACISLRTNESSAVDLTGSTESHIFAVVAGGWPRDLVVSNDSRLWAKNQKTST